MKTRLAASMGHQLAAAVYREMLEASLERFAPLAAEHVLAVSPADEQAAFAELAPAWNVVPQAEGDLGQRLEAFFASQFAAGYEKVVVVGADSPNLPLQYVRDGFARLDEAPVVLGPSDDGGYYLLGASGGPPPVFDEVPWGSSRVLQATLARLEKAEVEPALLPEWYDVDEPDDLNRLRLELAAVGEVDPPLVRLRAVLDALLPADARGAHDAD